MAWDPGNDGHEDDASDDAALEGARHQQGDDGKTPEAQPHGPRLHFGPGAGKDGCRRWQLGYNGARQRVKAANLLTAVDHVPAEPHEA